MHREINGLEMKGRSGEGSPASYDTPAAAGNDGGHYQSGLTVGGNESLWSAFTGWLRSASGATSIPYRIEGIDPKGVYPRVLTAVQVETKEGPAWAVGHVIDLEDSLLIAQRRFVDDDCPKCYLVEMA